MDNLQNLSSYQNISWNFKTLQALNDEEAEQRIPTIVYLCVLMLLGISGNTLVLIVYSLKYKNSNYRIFILCLAVIDMLACCVYMPTEIVDNRYPYMFFSEAACKICLFLGKVSTNGSAFILVVIAVDRFLKICRPLGSQLSSKTARVMCGIAVAFSILFAWPNAFVYGRKLRMFENNTVTGYACSVDDDIVNTEYPFIYNIVLMILFIIIFIILVISYTFIVIKTAKSYQFSRHFIRKNDKNGIQSVPRPNRKVTKIMFTITLVFILSYIPHFTLKTISTFKKGLVAPPSPIVLGIFPILSKSFFITNAANPFIYAIEDKHFRENAKNIFSNTFHVMCTFLKLKKEKELAQNSTEVLTNLSSKYLNGNVNVSAA